MADLDPHWTRVARLAVANISSRAQLAKRERLPLDKFWTFIPLKCRWCGTDLTPEQAFAAPDGFIFCVNQKACLRRPSRDINGNAPLPPERKQKMQAEQPGDGEEIDIPPITQQSIEEELLTLPEDHWLNENRKAMDERGRERVVQGGKVRTAMKPEVAIDGLDDFDL